VVINRVWDNARGQPRHDRREAAATSDDTYTVQPVFDSPDIVAELRWDGVGGDNVVVEYEWVPLDGAPGEVKVGDQLDAEQGEAVRSGELLEVSRQGAPGSDDAELWRAFASGLAGRGRAVTAREIKTLVLTQDYLGLDRLIEPDDISFDQYVGRVEGRKGLVPYTRISIRLVSYNGLSARDRQDVEYLLERHLAQAGALNQCFKVRLFDKQGTT